MATYGGSTRGEVGLEALFDGSPAPRARTSAAAEVALMTGLGAVITSPFSIFFGVSALLGGVAVLAGLVGLVTTHRADVAGSALTAFGTCFGLVAIALVGVRYVGVDTAVGDAVLPWVVDQLHQWNTRLPQPR